MDSAYASIPTQVEVIESPVSNKVQAALETPRVLFFGGDAITDQEKRQAPFKEHGGIHMPHVKTLRGTKGMLYKCALTLLPPFRMIPDARGMLGPNLAALEFKDSFTQTVVNADGTMTEKEISGFPVTVQESIKEGRFETKQSNHIVYKKRYAAQDVAMAIKRSVPHGPGGVVEITALAGATQREVSDAQLFFFPNWADIKAGREKLPERMSDVIAHLTARKGVIDTELPEVLRGKYHSIANDMLRSCTEFVRTANETVRSDGHIVQNAVSKGLAGQVTHSQMSEKFLEQTGAQRKEDLLSGEVASVGELAKEMREDRLAHSKVKEKELELKERELFLREVELGIRKSDGSLVGEVKTPTAERPFTEPTIIDATDTHILIADENTTFAMAEPTSEVICGAPTANGTCARVATKGDKCWQHVDGD